MTEIMDDEVRLSAEDLEFVVHRPYWVRHGCGTQIIGLGRDMHDALAEHTAHCDWMEPCS